MRRIHLQDLRGQVPGGCVHLDRDGVHLGGVRYEQGQGRIWTRDRRGARVYAGRDHVRISDLPLWWAIMALLTAVKQSPKAVPVLDHAQVSSCDAAR